MNATATGHGFSLTVMVVLALAAIGLLMWALLSNAPAKGTFAELGRALLYSGLVAFMVAISGSVFHC